MSVRLTYRDGFRNHPTLENVKDGVIQVSEIIEKSDYYPFGLKQKGDDLPDYSVVNKYKYGYGGKELNDELGLDLYDFGARNYDPALGRWLNVDPLAENSRRCTPYNYAYNNPIFFVDPDGMQAKKFEELKPVGDVNDLMVSNGYYETKIGDFSGAANFSGFYGNSQYQGVDHDPPGGGNDRPLGQPNYEQKPNNNQSYLVPFPSSGSNYVGGYPGQALDELITAGIQWLGGVITSADVSKETSENLQLATNLVIVVASKGKNSKAGADVVESVIGSEIKAVSSRAARREVMRQQGIPTSQQPFSQSKNASGREYTYVTSKAGGGTRIKSVQQQTLDSSHRGQPHWEAAAVKSDNGTIFMNAYGRPKLVNNKSKVYY